MIALEKAPAVSRVLAHQEEHALAPLLLAFANDPAVRWMYPDPYQYRTFFPRFARAFGGRAFAHGTARTVEGGFGSALWLPPGILPDEEVLAPFLQETVQPDRLDELFALLELMSQHHPSRPHWYLTLMGVDPLYQGLGFGSALLSQQFERFDRLGEIVYLEASNPQNVPFYEHHGFELRGEIRTGDSPTLYAMVREPR